MGAQQQKEIERSYNTSTNGFDQKASALKIRLDATKLIEDIELYLSSTMIQVFQNEDGKLYQKRQQFGTPKANEEGVQSILSVLGGILNAQIVQGNFELHEDYESYIQELNISLATNFMINRIKWGITKENYEFIIDTIMLMLIPFMTRLIRNKERESIGETIRTVESSRITDERGGGGMKLFGGNKE
jgi:hypothetical protein